MIPILQFSNDAFMQNFVTSVVKTATLNGGKNGYAVTDTIDREWAATVQLFNNNNNSDSLRTADYRYYHRPEHNLLIAQYASAPIHSSNDGIYNQFLNVTSQINQAYAIRWKYDYIILSGIMDFKLPWNKTFHVERYIIDGIRVNATETDNNNRQYTRSPGGVPESRATYNKLGVLDWALTQTKYDCLLILDADAMMFDFSRDITSLLPPEYSLFFGSSIPKRGPFLVAHKTNRTDVPGTGSINVGVTLWNLRHPLTRHLLQQWKSLCLRRIRSGKDDDDQAPLQNLLKDDLDAAKRARVVHAISKEFAYANGAWVKHFIRPAGSTWSTGNNNNNNSTDKSNNSATDRLDQMQRTANEVCSTYFPICNQ